MIYNIYPDSVIHALARFRRLLHMVPSNAIMVKAPKTAARTIAAAAARLGFFCMSAASF